MRSLLPLTLPLLLLAPARDDGDPVFVARTAAGKEFTGPVARLDSDWALEVGKGARRKVAGGDLIELRQKDVPLPPMPSDEHLITAGGDRVPFRSLRLEDEKVFLRHPDLGGEEVRVPLSSVLLVWRQGPDRALSPEKLRRALLGAKRTRDVVLLRNGDRIEGTLNSIGRDVQVEVEKKLVNAKWGQVAAIALSTELADKPKAAAAAGRLVLTATDRSPGGRFTITSPSLLNGELRGKTSFGATVRVPLERVASLELLGGKAVPLSALKPSRYEYRPYLDEKWPYTLDASVTGRDLRVGGSGYERGVGMHASSALVYDLAGKYRRFEALVGLDDSDGRRGKVRVRVLLDGKEADIGHKGDLTHKGGPWRINLGVEGAKAMTLEVLAADDGPVQAVVDWVEARLVQ